MLTSYTQIAVMVDANLLCYQELPDSLPKPVLKGKRIRAAHLLASRVSEHVFISTSLRVALWGYKVFSIICSVILRIAHLGWKELKEKKKKQTGNTMRLCL